MNNSTEYPKWVRREQDIGLVLCNTAAEEQALLDDWAAQKLARAEEAAAAAKAEASQAEEAAQVVLGAAAPAPAQGKRR